MRLDWNTWEFLTLFTFGLMLFIAGYLGGYIHQRAELKEAERDIMTAEKLIADQTKMLGKYRKMFREELKNRR